MSRLANLEIVKKKFPDGTPVHDAFVTAYLVDNSLTKGNFVNVEVETLFRSYPWPDSSRC